MVNKIKRTKSPDKEVKRPFRILSFDGGGLKGVFAAFAINKLKTEYQIDILDYFDLVVGTSTGAIIASSLLNGLSSKSLLNSYLEDGNVFFLNRNKLSSQLKKSFFAKFDDTYLNQQLKLNLKNLTFSELETKSGKQFLFTATNFNEAKPVIFASSKFSSVNKRYLTLPVWAAIRASAAAPLFFEPVKEPVTNCELIDGGIWANNPALLAITLAHTDLGIKFKDLRLLSFGQTAITDLTFKNYNFNEIIKSPLKITEHGFRSLIISMVYTNQNFATYLTDLLLTDHQYRYEPELNFFENNLNYFSSDFMAYCQSYWDENKASLLKFLEEDKNDKYRINEINKYN